jgi:hypothetical protein
MDFNVLDVVKQMNEGTKIDSISAKLGINRKKLSKLIKENGYIYSQSAKAWNPINEELAAASDASATGEKSVKDNARKAAKESDKNSRMLQGEFTSKEIAILRDIIKDYSKEKPTAATHSIYDRVLTLDKGHRTRKTIVIDKTIGARLDAFKKKNKIDKSDVLEIALLDFFEKYDA